MIMRRWRGAAGHRSARWVFERLPDRGDSLAWRRQNSHRRQRSSVYDLPPVDEDLILTVPAVYGVDVDFQLASDPRRHTDGVNARDSIHAVAKYHSSQIPS
jgi:hypothetical protein